MPAKRILFWLSSLPGPMAGGPGGTGTDPWYREKPVSLSHRASGVRRIPKRDHWRPASGQGTAGHPGCDGSPSPVLSGCRSAQPVGRMDLRNYPPFEGWANLYADTAPRRPGGGVRRCGGPQWHPLFFPGDRLSPDLAGGILLQRHGPPPVSPQWASSGGCYPGSAGKLRQR